MDRNNRRTAGAKHQIDWLSSEGLRPPAAVNDGSKMTASKRPFAGCGKLSAMLDARLKRKECTKCHWIHATRLYDVSVA
jgi:hypothetical protein